MQRLPAHFKYIRLELAREPAHPQGNKLFAYHLFAPLDSDGHIDAAIFHDHKAKCRVIRTRPNEDSVIGHLRRRPGGSWAFHYKIDGRDDDDPGYRFSEHKFVVGEYVTIFEDDGQHPYRISAVDSPTSPAAIKWLEVAE